MFKFAAELPCRLLPLCLMVLSIVDMGGVSARAQGQVEAVAIAGKPFGVLRITMPNTFKGESFDIFSPDGRALYPSSAANGQPVRRLIRNLLKIDGPPSLTGYCLFKGDAPLTVRLHSPDGPAVQLRVLHDPAGHAALLNAWWTAFRAPTRMWNKTEEYPPQVENYLTTMLSRRLNLPLEEKQYSLFEDNQIDDVLGPLVGTESARVNLQRQIMLGKFARVEPANLQLPEIVRPQLEVPEPDGAVKIEPIARHVPAECLYLRFGGFLNYAWMGVMTEQAGGELRNLIAVRGFNYQIQARIQNQLGLHENELAQLLGGFVISDVAIVCADTFFREGAGMGVLFEARNSTLLSGGLNQERAELLESQPDAQEEKLDIDGHEVSHIYTPDGRVRSYYAVDGDYHFVTTSRKLAERFLQAGAGEGALGDEPDFVFARSEMPLSRKDTIFVYLSEAFLREISSPHYRIEMKRRLQSVAELEVLQLARLAAKAEGVRGDSVEDLVLAGLLPHGFGQHSDGSRTVLADGVATDTVRGPRGAFVPAPDMPVASISQAELADYQAFATAFQDQWQRLNPIVVGIKRKALPGDHHELVTIDARMTPLGVPQYDWLASQLGPPDSTQLAGIPGDLATLEINTVENRLFGGLRDLGPYTPTGGPRPVPNGFMSGPIMGLLTTNPREYLTGYVGATPTLGLLAWLDDPRFGPPDAAGWSSFSGLLGPSYRRYINGMATYSYHGNLLAEVTPQLRYVEAERPAQVRLRVEDLRGAYVGTILNLLAYSRARGSSLGNARFLSSLEQQFHVPQDACLDTAEQILGARPVCPLGGEYVVRMERSGQRHWGSSAWNDDGKPMMPDTYNAPTQDWMRSLDAELVFDRDSLIVYAQLDMQFGEETVPKAEDIPAPAPDEGGDDEVEALPIPAPDKPKTEKPAPEVLEDK
ncbi:MAG: hypothetical protein AB7O62_09550 [Pirellulales bacterium]